MHRLWKILIRGTALFLIPCLLVESSSASAFSSTARAPSSCPILAEQAFSIRAAEAWTQWRQGHALLKRQEALLGGFLISATSAFAQTSQVVEENPGQTWVARVTVGTILSLASFITVVLLSHRGRSWIRRQFSRIKRSRSIHVLYGTTGEMLERRHSPEPVVRTLHRRLKEEMPEIQRLGKGTRKQRLEALDRFKDLLKETPSDLIQSLSPQIEDFLMNNLRYRTWRDSHRDSEEVVAELALKATHLWLSNEPPLSHFNDFFESALRALVGIDGYYTYNYLGILRRLVPSPEQEENVIDVLARYAKQAGKSFPILADYGVRIVKRRAAAGQSLPFSTLRFRDQIIDYYLNGSHSFFYQDVYHLLPALRDLPVHPPVMTPQLLASVTQLKSAISSENGFTPTQVGVMQLTYLGYLPELGKPPASWKMQPIQVQRDEGQELLHPGFIGGRLTGSEGPLEREFGDLWVLKDPDLSKARRIMIRPLGETEKEITPDPSWYWIPFGVEKSGSRAIYVHQQTGLVASICIDTLRTQKERATFVAENLYTEFVAAEVKARGQSLRRPAGEPEDIFDVPGLSGVLHLRERLGQMPADVRSFVQDALEKKLRPVLSRDAMKKFQAPYEETSGLGSVDPEFQFEQLLDWIRQDIEGMGAEEAVGYFVPAQEGERTESDLPFVFTDAGYERVGEWLGLPNRDPDSVIPYLRALANPQVRLGFIKLPLVQMLVGRLSKGVFSHEETNASHYTALQHVHFGSKSLGGRLNQPKAWRAMEENRMANNLAWREARRTSSAFWLLRQSQKLWDESLEHLYMLRTRLDQQATHTHLGVAVYIILLAAWLVGESMKAVANPSYSGIFDFVHDWVRSLINVQYLHYMLFSESLNDPMIELFGDQYGFVALLGFIWVSLAGFYHQLSRAYRNSDRTTQVAHIILAGVLFGLASASMWVSERDYFSNISWVRWLWSALPTWQVNLYAPIVMVGGGYLLYKSIDFIHSGLQRLFRGLPQRSWYWRSWIRMFPLALTLVLLLQETTLARFYATQYAVRSTSTPDRLAAVQKAFAELSFDEIRQLLQGSYRKNHLDQDLFYTSEEPFLYALVEGYIVPSTALSDFLTEPTTPGVVRMAALLDTLSIAEARQAISDGALRHLQRQTLESVRAGWIADPVSRLKLFLSYPARLPELQNLLQEPLGTSMKGSRAEAEVQVFRPALEGLGLDWRQVVKDVIEDIQSGRVPVATFKPASVVLQAA